MLTMVAGEVVYPRADAERSPPSWDAELASRLPSVELPATFVTLS